MQFLSLLKKASYGGNFWFSSLSALSNHSLGRTFVSLALRDFWKEFKRCCSTQPCWHILTHWKWVKLARLNSNDWFADIWRSPDKGFVHNSFSRKHNWCSTRHNLSFFLAKISILSAKWVEFFISWFVRTNNCQIWKTTSKF